MDSVAYMVSCLGAQQLESQNSFLGAISMCTACTVLYENVKVCGFQIAFNFLDRYTKGEYYKL